MTLIQTPPAAQDWRPCEKVTPTRARPLTQADYDERQGCIQTREGPTPFVAGDYLAQDDMGEYPISKATIEHFYACVHAPDSQGWAWYRSTERREARRMSHAFSTDRGVSGQAGDYLLRGSDGRTWPCARAKFEQEYRRLAQHIREDRA